MKVGIYLEKLWAPWRSVYIGKEHDKGCVFCEVLKTGDDARNYILWRGKKVFAIMNLYPYNNGHLLIVPVRHIADIGQMDQEEILEVGLAVQKATRVISLAMNPDSFNIGVNMGKAAGAGVPDHFHVHVVPRWRGDTNFMPVLGNTKVISEGLDQTYRKLLEALRKEKD